MKKKIFVTGGHVTPALALIDELKDKCDIVFIGRVHAMEGSRIDSMEYSMVQQAGVKFLPLTAGRLQRYVTRFTLGALVKIPIGFVQALVYCLQEKPSLIVSFGGYIALPVAIAGWLLRIPVVTHEQTRTIGLTNRFIANLATKVYVSFEDQQNVKQGKKYVVTGLPLRKQLFAKEKQPFSLDSDSPILYVTGGATGAASLNALVKPVLPTLMKTYTVIHQIGEDASFKEEMGKRYIAKRYFNVKELAWIFQHAHIIVSRSGANTTMELATLGKVAFLVPLPWAAGNEQLLNAKWLVRSGGCVLATQQSLTPNSLKQEIAMLEQEYTSFKNKADQFSKTVSRDGARTLAKEIYAVLG